MLPGTLGADKWVGEDEDEDVKVRPFHTSYAIWRLRLCSLRHHVYLYRMTFGCFRNWVADCLVLQECWEDEEEEKKDEEKKEEKAPPPATTKSKSKKLAEKLAEKEVIAASRLFVDGIWHGVEVTLFFCFFLGSDDGDHRLGSFGRSRP